MKKIHKIYLIIALVGIGFVLGLIIFSIGKTPQENVKDLISEAPKKEIQSDLSPINGEEYYHSSNILTINQGSAIIIRKEGIEEEITTEAEVNQGDTIKVKEKSLATILWFDDSISRLNGESEVTITSAEYNPEIITKTNINIQAIQGEIWSKVSNLVDEDSEFTVEGKGIVAGVRGSAFNFSIEGEIVEVESIEHAVFIKRDGDEKVLPEGKKRRIDIEKNEEKREDIPKERWKEEWFLNNTTKDEEAKKELQEKLKDRLKNRITLLPGEEGHEELEQKRNEEIEKIEDEEKKLSAKINLTRKHIDEILYLIKEKKTSSREVQKIAILIDEMIDEVNRSTLTESEKDKLYKMVKTISSSAEKTLSGVLPDDQIAYKAKEILREKSIDAEQDKEKKLFLQKKMIERKLYDLIDLLKEQSISPEEFREKLRLYEQELKNMKEMIQSDPLLKEIGREILRRMNTEGLLEKDIKDILPFFEEEREEEETPEEPEEESIEEAEVPPRVPTPIVPRTTPTPPTPTTSTEAEEEPVRINPKPVLTPEERKALLERIRGEEEPPPPPPVEPARIESAEVTPIPKREDGAPSI